MDYMLFLATPSSRPPTHLFIRGDLKNGSNKVYFVFKRWHAH